MLRVSNEGRSLIVFVWHLRGALGEKPRDLWMFVKRRNESFPGRAFAGRIVLAVRRCKSDPFAHKHAVNLPEECSTSHLSNCSAALAGYIYKRTPRIKNCYTDRFMQQQLLLVKNSAKFRKKLIPFKTRTSSVSKFGFWYRR